MNVFSASPVPSFGPTYGRLQKLCLPRDPEGRRGAMSETDFNFLAYLLYMGVLAWLILR